YFDTHVGEPRSYTLEMRDHVEIRQVENSALVMPFLGLVVPDTGGDRRAVAAQLAKYADEMAIWLKGLKGCPLHVVFAARTVSIETLYHDGVGPRVVIYPRDGSMLIWIFIFLAAILASLAIWARESERSP
ncbi:MAG: hypothetical protein ACK4SY_10705, partial [Pyrobaculum sp.]